MWSVSVRQDVAADIYRLRLAMIAGTLCVCGQLEADRLQFVGELTHLGLGVGG